MQTTVLTHDMKTDLEAFLFWFWNMFALRWNVVLIDCKLEFACFDKVWVGNEYQTLTDWVLHKTAKESEFDILVFFNCRYKTLLHCPPCNIICLYILRISLANMTDNVSFWKPLDWFIEGNHSFKWFIFVLSASFSASPIHHKHLFNFILIFLGHLRHQLLRWLLQTCELWIIINCRQILISIQRV